MGCEICKIVCGFVPKDFCKISSIHLFCNFLFCPFEFAIPPKVEDNIGAVPHGLSIDSNVVKRELESFSKRLHLSNTKKFEFQAEVSRLISNASSALDKIRFLSITDKEILGEGDNAKLEIQIKLDKEKKILYI
ncbi:unnamed protein product [Trifolium pratense]|uniref:Uncharacterized protein n=1 Tax=Trifolium pratense TaxID=57577 RepID=A0ACB0J662_TRIPR|nr:unnamed protein product [Trifolium pratense]